jgi:hypothetical protein
MKQHFSGRVAPSYSGIFPCFLGGFLSRLKIIGLLVMGGLVPLGAPFWNDVLKGISGLNDALNSKKN